MALPPTAEERAPQPGKRSGHGVLRRSQGKKAHQRREATSTYQDGGSVQLRQLVYRPQHRHPSRRPNRRLLCARASQTALSPAPSGRWGARCPLWAGLLGAGRGVLKGAGTSLISPPPRASPQVFSDSFIHFHSFMVVRHNLHSFPILANSILRIKVWGHS